MLVAPMETSRQGAGHMISEIDSNFQRKFYAH